MPAPEVRELFPGIALIRSTLGGFSVEADGDYIGWIHASSGDYWNAYLRVPGAEGHYLGRFHPQIEAARHIIEASGRPSGTPPVKDPSVGGSKPQ